MRRTLAASLMLVGTVCFADPTEQQITDGEIQQLVAKLASPNEPPEINIPALPKYGSKYDKGAQRDVADAWRQLRKLAPRSFPFVFDHVSDKRYALTEDSGDFYKNYSVGDLCRDVLVSHLQPDVDDRKDPGTSFRRRPNQPDYIRHFGILNPKSAREWWKTRKDRSLRELQIEVLEWVLAEEEKQREKYTDAERARVKKELDELKATDMPRKPGFPFAK